MPWYTVRLHEMREFFLHSASGRDSTRSGAVVCVICVVLLLLLIIGLVLGPNETPWFGSP